MRDSVAPFRLIVYITKQKRVGIGRVKIAWEIL